LADRLYAHHAAAAAALLQVVDIATQTPLLSSPIPGCGEVLLWWGTSSDTLAYSHRTSNSNTELRLIKLPPQQQQQQQALLYVPIDGERGLDLELTADKQFVVLSTSVQVRYMVCHPWLSGGCACDSA
jgi:hypothetical protein